MIGLDDISEEELKEPIPGFIIIEIPNDMN